LSYRLNLAAVLQHLHLWISWICKIKQRHSGRSLHL